MVDAMVCRLVLFLSLFCVSPQVFGGNFFVLPRPGTGGQISTFSENPFALLATIPTVSDPKFIFSNLTGNRAYVISASGTIVVLDSSNAFTELTRYSLGSSVSAAVATNDGRKLLVLAGELRVIDLANDRPSIVPRVSVGSLPISVTASTDSKTAFVVSSTDSMLYAVDLAANTVVTQQRLNMAPSTVAVGPNGLVYVGGQGRLLEFDFLNGLALTFPGGVSFDGNAEALQFTPNGQNIVLLEQASTVTQRVLVINLPTRTVTSAPSEPNVLLKQLKVVSNTTAFALGNGLVYTIPISPLGPPSVALLGVGDQISGIGISNELPNARTLFLASANSATKIDLSSRQTVGPFSILSGDMVSYTPTSSNGSVNKLQNNTLDVPTAPNSTTQPIIVQATDINGVPVNGATVQFSTTASGVVLSQSQAATNTLGIAVIRATVPAGAATHIIRAIVDGNNVEIPIKVSSSATSQNQLTITSGNGQIINAGSLSQPFQVKVLDTNGNPIPNAQVNWSIQSGTGVSLVGAPSSSTNNEGVAMLLVTTTNFSPTEGDYVRPFTIAASVVIGPSIKTLTLVGVVYPTPSQPPMVEIKNNLNVVDGEVVIPAGTVISDAFRVRTLSGLSIALGKPISNVGIRAYTQGTSVPLVACQDNPVSDLQGVAHCNLVVGTTVGSATLGIIVGESNNYTYSYPVRIIPGVPKKLSIIQGDGQVGAPGSITPQALLIEVQDALGNPLNGASVDWSVVSGDAALQSPRMTTDSSGRASTLIQFGMTPGAVSVRAAVNGLEVVFKLTNGSVSSNTISIVDGDGQSSPVHSNFAAPLRVKVSSSNGDPIPGINVTFQVTSGTVSLSQASVVTDAQGIASVSVTAGGSIGPAKVSATLSGVSVKFNLSVTDVGPRIDSVVNGASFREGVAACSVAVVKGTGFTQGFSGVISSGNDVIPVLAYSLKGVSVQVNGVSAPLYYISNIDGVEQIGVQIPCESANGANTVSVSALGQTATKEITIADAAPGIFETEFTPGIKQGVVVKADGSYVSPSNPAVQGETLTGFFTGLMPTAQPRTTNAVGTGQTADTSRIIIGLNNAGMPSVSAQYAPNMIGVYTVKFVVDPPAGSGDKQAYSIGIVDSSGNTIYSNTSTLPVR